MKQLRSRIILSITIAAVLLLPGCSADYSSLTASGAVSDDGLSSAPARSPLLTCARAAPPFTYTPDELADLVPPSPSSLTSPPLTIMPGLFAPISSNEKDSAPLLLSQLADAATTAPANGDVDQLSKQLANPVASLISVPLQSNFDFNGGPHHDGWRYTLNIQPVIPIKLSDNWNLISRTILPVIYQDKMANDRSQFGLGDTNASFFFSPSKPGPGGLIWGAGPIFLLPTSTQEFLGAHRWGIGPTGLILVQKGPWTYGILANHIWSTGRDISFNAIDGDTDVSNTFLQPFVSYNFGKGLSATLNSESTYNWKAHEWTVPINVNIAQIVPIGGHPISFGLGARAYAAGPSGTPVWGLRLNVTFLFPEK